MGTPDMDAYVTPDIRYKEGSWSIVGDRIIMTGKETFTVRHDCPSGVHAAIYRFRPFSFQRCKTCEEKPSEEFQAMYRLLIWGNKEDPGGIG